MKYNFFVGDYVETKSGTIGFVTNDADVECEFPRWMPTKLSLTDIHNNLYSLDKSYCIIDEDVEKRFNRIGRYDFTKIEEIEPLIVKQYNDYCNSKLMWDKINELIDAVNQLREKV